MRMFLSDACVYTDSLLHICSDAEFAFYGFPDFDDQRASGTGCAHEVSHSAQTLVAGFNLARTSLFLPRLASEPTVQALPA